MNLLLIFGLEMGILGAGIGLSITQSLMAAVMVIQVLRGARRHRVSLHPSRSGVLSSAREGLPLFIRTLSLRVALLATVAVATQAGTLALAGHQVVNSIWGVAAFAMDALAIAAQGLVGVALGSADSSPAAFESQRRAQLRVLVRKLTVWGVLGAGIIGIGVAALSPWLPQLFGSSPQMHQVAFRALLIAGLLMSISGAVFVLDGVLIGASEGSYLAQMGVATLAVYLPALGGLLWWIRSGSPLDVAGQTTALAWLWVAFAGLFMATRCVANMARAFSPKLGVKTS